jgi:hypothetical protein
LAAPSTGGKVLFPLLQHPDLLVLGKQLVLKDFLRMGIAFGDTACDGVF